MTMVMTKEGPSCRFGHVDVPPESPRHCEITGEIPFAETRYDAEERPIHCTCETCASYWTACAWCSGAFPPRDPNDPPSFCGWCCSFCSNAWTDKYQPGEWVMVGDLTPEQLNEALNDIGLGLEGIGPRKPS